MRKLILILFATFLISGISYSQNTNRILFEGCTGAWCGYCPCGHEILQTLLTANPSMLVLEYHGGGTDPWTTFNGSNIISLMGYTAYPRAAFGRREGNLNRAYWAGAVTNQVNIVPPISLSFTYNYVPSTRQLTVNVSSTALRNIDTTTIINCVLTESNLIAYQNCYSSCTPGAPVQNYVHNYVVRTMLKGAIGDTLTTGTWAQGVTKTKTFTTTLDNGWNANNIEIGTYVFFGTPNGTLNSQCFVLQTAKNSIVTGVRNNGEVAEGFNLLQNYPNPFNPTTNIKFTIPKDGFTTLKVYDILGNEVAVLCNCQLKAGAYNAGFEGSKLSSGVYFYKLTSGDFTDIKKMMLVK
jgi:hypothetical protein